MFTELTDELLSALNQAGFPAFREYPQPRRSVPAGVFFMTAAEQELECGAAFPCEDGSAVPAVLTLRVRYHCRSDADMICFAEQADAVLRGQLRAKSWDIRRMHRGDIRYEKQIDRLVCETIWVLRGLVIDTLDEEAENGDNI